MKIERNAKKQKIICIFLTVSLLVLSGCSKTTPTDPFSQGADVIFSEKMTNAFDAEVNGNTDFVLAAENETMQIYVKGSTAEIRTVNKTTGVEWFSNPQKRATDPIAMGDSVVQMESQLYITFIDGMNKVYNYFSKTDSMDYNQVAFQKIENGLRVRYTIGKSSDFFILPVVITKDRMDGFCDKLSPEDKDELITNYDLISLNEQSDESVKKLLLQRYPTIETMDLYIFKMVRNSLDEIKRLPAFLGLRVEELFRNAGYTKDDLKKDYIDNKLVPPEQTNPVFEIPVDYTLDKSDLIVTVPYKDIKFDTKKFYLTGITVLPFMGAADTTQKGYMFVPDGAGAIINLNNGKSNYQPYSKPVYGRDRSIFLKTVESKDNTPVYLPVFGMKLDTATFLAVIESGDAQATIHADVSGRYSSFNSINASFNLTPNSIQTESVLNLSGGTNFQEKPMQSDIRIRYLFLDEPGADYTKMALAYQDYLIKNNQIQKRDFKQTMPMTINLLGSLQYKTSYFGFPVSATKALTRYREAKSILEQIKAGGLENITLKYEGWSNGGISNTVANKVDLTDELGGRKGFEELSLYCTENSIEFYPDVDFSYVTNHSALDGFDSNTAAARDLSNAVASDYSYSLDLFHYMGDSVLKRTIVSPAKMEQLVSPYFNSYKNLGLKNVSLSNLGTDLNADFRKNNQTDRQKARDDIMDVIKKVSSLGYSISVDGANAYALNNAAYVMDMQLDCGYSYLFDESVPFYPIALHGILAYTGKPLNTSADMEYETLKMIETGANPYFEWTFSDNSEMKETEYNYYGLDYKLWLADAHSIYKKVNDAIGDCQNVKIEGHKQIAIGVYKTIYGNGKTVYVNYNKSPVDIEGISIQARNYLAVKGE